MRRNLQKGLALVLLFALFAAGVPLRAAAKKSAGSGKEPLTVTREFHPFDWNAYTDSPYVRLGAHEYAGSYGSELSKEQKQLYDALEGYYLDSGKNFSSGRTDALTFVYPQAYTANTEETYSFLKNELLLNSSYAYWAFVYDHPEAYWAGSVRMSLNGTKSDGIYRMESAGFDISEKYAGAKSQTELYRTGVETAAAKIRAEAASAGREHIVKAIHDYLCSRLSYNYEALKRENAENPAYRYAYSNGAVFTGKNSVVCQGYAEAFKVLADQFGIPCADIVGTTQSGTHMWNYVQMEDQNWYAVDCTWDDQNPIGYAYFLCGADSEGLSGSFREEHTEKPCFSENEDIVFIYPPLAQDAYELSACVHRVCGWRTVKAPDCITEGRSEKVCRSCGAAVDAKAIPATKNLTDGCTLNIGRNLWTYTGAAIRPEAALLCNGKAVEAGCYQIDYFDNVKAGFARVLVTGRNGYRGTLTGSFVIQKADSSIWLTGATEVYSGNEVRVPKAEHSGSSGFITYTYYTDAACTSRTSESAHKASAPGAAPRYAGTYYVKAALEADENYNGAVSSPVKLVITKGTASVRLKPKTAAYTGRAVSVDKATVTFGAGKVTYTYYTDKKCTKKTSRRENGSSGTGKAPKLIGTYYVKAAVAENGNCYGAVSRAVKLVIKKGTPVIRLTGKTAAYTGSAVSVGKAKVTGGAGKITYVYYTDAKCTRKTSKPKNGSSGAGKDPKYAGIYYVRALSASNSKYTGAKSNTVKLIIRPGRASISGAKNIPGRKIKIKWPAKTGTGTASGMKYIVEYSTDKKFKSDVEQAVVSGNKTSCTISGLKRGRTYYVRIKAYSVKQKTYGKAGKIKAVKITR